MTYLETVVAQMYASVGEVSSIEQEAFIDHVCPTRETVRLFDFNGRFDGSMIFRAAGTAGGRGDHDLVFL